MEAPRVEDRGAYNSPCSISFRETRIYQINIEEDKPIHYIPTRLKNTNNTKLISKDDYFSTFYPEFHKLITYVVVYLSVNCESDIDIVIISIFANGKVAAAIVSAAAVAFVDQSAAADPQNSATYINVDPGFGQHVNNLRGTMFYVCQGSCLCGTVNNRGKVIYCYGDLVPRHGELFAEGAEGSGTTTSKDLLAAQLGIWTFGIIAL